MKPDYRLCDICGSKTNHSLFVRTGRSMDAAGDSEDDGEHLDLCGSCLCNAVSVQLRSLSNPLCSDRAAGLRLLEWVKKAKHKHSKTGSKIWADAPEH